MPRTSTSKTSTKQSEKRSTMTGFPFATIDEPDQAPAQEPVQEHIQQDEINDDEFDDLPQETDEGTPNETSQQSSSCTEKTELMEYFELLKKYHKIKSDISFEDFEKPLTEQAKLGNFFAFDKCAAQFGLTEAATRFLFSLFDNKGKSADEKATEFIEIPIGKDRDYYFKSEVCKNASVKFEICYNRMNWLYITSKTAKGTEKVTAKYLTPKSGNKPPKKYEDPMLMKHGITWSQLKALVDIKTERELNQGGLLWNPEENTWSWASGTMRVLGTFDHNGDSIKFLNLFFDRETGEISMKTSVGIVPISKTMKVVDLYCEKNGVKRDKFGKPLHDKFEQTYLLNLVKEIRTKMTYNDDYEDLTK